MEMVESITWEIINNLSFPESMTNENSAIGGNFYPDLDYVIAVLDAGGLPANHYSPIVDMIYEVKVRAPKYEEAADLTKQIFKLFRTRNHYQLQENYIYASYEYTKPTYLFKDDKNRSQFTVSFVFAHKI